MYSFEGDYRRRPQQNLAGASRRDEKAALLQHAQLERNKREQQRKRQNAALKIHAQTRSYLVRQSAKRNCRIEFDRARAQVQSKLQVNDLIPYIRTLLFFYDAKIDYERLIWLLEHILSNKEKILNRYSNTDWLWRLRWILKLCLQFIVEITNINRQISTALPLRVLESFINDTQATKNNNDTCRNHLRDILKYLVLNSYFWNVKKLLEESIPPLDESTSTPPTPRVKCYFDLIKQPLVLSTDTKYDNDFAMIVIKEFVNTILVPRMSDPVRLFLIPSLSELSSFPYAELICCINRLEIVPTRSLLYAVLSLEPTNFNPSSSDTVLVNYIQVLASLTSTTLGPLPSETPANDIVEDDDMSISDTEAVMVDQSQVEIMLQCIKMLNEDDRVHRILTSLDKSEDQAMLQSLCQLCHNLLRTDKLASHKYKLLYMLAFKPEFVRRLWSALITTKQTSIFGGGSTPLVQIMSRGIAPTAEDSKNIASLIAVFCSLFSLLIATLHDSEFFTEAKETSMEDEEPENERTAMPFTTGELVPLSDYLKGVCLGLVELAFPDCRPTVRDDYKRAVLGPSTKLLQDKQDTQMWVHLFKATSGLLRQLHTRDLRRQFCPDGHWITSNIPIPLDKPQDITWRRRTSRTSYSPFQGLRSLTQDQEESEHGPPLSTKEIRMLTLLREVPFIVPFNDRVMVLQSLIYRDKMEHQGELTHFMQGPSIQISVRRNYLYEDALDKLSSENEPELRLKMRVQLVNTAGVEEAGVDGGGLFREFLSELLKTSFDPNRGFFRLTKDNMLYPNPTVHLLVDDFPKHYYFIGRMMGKAIYENLLVELPFAEFFLSKIVGRQSDVDVHHLASLDPVMYRNLLYLKSYKGDVSDLGLDFTVLSDELGERRIDELKPKGSQIPVTNDNRIEYIHLMADYKLNKEIRPQCFAFKQGIANVIPLEWLQMFNNKEMQVLISGAQIPVDVDDLKMHTNYTGGYAPDHPTITAFWRVVEGFTNKQKGQLLKFVTSCSRPPLLGFKELDPPFCIQHAGTIDRLPTSSTCMNLLKLPEFLDESTLREKLLYAIQAGAGFELS
ncbi:ubiquitin-protein ligase E3C [Fopius arisanus]|uniref:Ubiquitin-protein ligase E3C n=2 Tax=Fopius arisanus TaxID=64838 RepID=A0A0C9RNM0_9HYME|nr:PREDICTED: ubiquitin-protein ligase E3C [Fopius arisanus]